MENLDLSHNSFDELPVISGNLELLKELKEWDVGIGLFVNLTRLDISHNRISTWPLQLENLRELQRLNISFNKLTALNTQCLSSFKYLIYFNACNNHLDSFPSCLYDAPLHVSVILLCFV